MVVVGRERKKSALKKNDCVCVLYIYIKAGSVRPVAADCVCDQTMFCLVS